MKSFIAIITMLVVTSAADAQVQVRARLNLGNGAGGHGGVPAGFRQGNLFNRGSFLNQGIDALGLGYNNLNFRQNFAQRGYYNNNLFVQQQRFVQPYYAAPLNLQSGYCQQPAAFIQPQAIVYRQPIIYRQPLVYQQPLMLQGGCEQQALGLSGCNGGTGQLILRSQFRGY